MQAYEIKQNKNKTNAQMTSFHLPKKIRKRKEKKELIISCKDTAVTKSSLCINLFNVCKNQITH